MSKIYQYKSISAEFKDIDAKKGIVSGYFNAFNVKDSDGDIILPGFFKKSIEERGPKSNRPRIKWFENHDPTRVPGRLTELKEDDFGLFYVGQAGTHSIGQDHIKMIESGVITEHSIGFKTLDHEQKSDANYLKDGILWEGSGLTSWGANEFTPITGLKSAEKISKIEQRMKVLEKFCRNTDATDETIEGLLIEIKQLNQLLVDILSEKATSAAVEAPGPVEEKNYDELVLAIHLINKQFKGIS